MLNVFHSSASLIHMPLGMSAYMWLAFASTSGAHACMRASARYRYVIQERVQSRSTSRVENVAIGCWLGIRVLVLDIGMNGTRNACALDVVPQVGVYVVQTAPSNHLIK